MTTEKPETYTAGVVVYPSDNGMYVRLRIVALDSDGNVAKVIGGIDMPPEASRKVAERITWTSWKVDGTIPNE